MSQSFVELVRNVSKSRQGRLFLWMILAECGVYTLSYGAGKDSTDFNEGRRSIGLFLIDAIGQADPTCYPRILTEGLDERDSTDPDGTDPR